MQMQTPITDETTRQTVLRELAWDATLDAEHISVQAKNGAITLSGHVTSYPAKRAALRATERVYGVRAVADELDVQLPGTSVRDDAQVAEEIARLIRWNSVVPDHVQAEVRGGHVTLLGEVSRGFERSAAERAVRYLAGVVGITNSIVVKATLPNAEDVDHRVGEAIERMADLDARSIWVTTSNGTVHLHGHVHSLAERRTAARAAASAPGVTHVENDIHVTL